MKFSFTLDSATFSKSIFCDANCFEVVNPEMVNGFIVNKMGIKFHKSGKFKSMPYANELKLMESYQKNYIADTKVAVKYDLSKHKWGRVQAAGSLSLSLFHRPTRHSLCADTYVDFDMVNCQPTVVNQVCLQNGIHNTQCIAYCADPKKWRYSIAKHHNLKPIYIKDKQVTIQPYEQAKKLFINLSFGGSYSAWRKTYNAEGDDIIEVTEMEAELSNVMDRIWKDNEAMINDVTKASEEWKKKPKEARKRSIMGLWAQSVERMIQESCICSICEHIEFSLDSIVPCQDGFMVLQSELDRCRPVFGENTSILAGMESELKRIFDFDIKWEIKPFNEPLASGIPLVKKGDVDATLINEKSFEFMCAEFEKTHCKIHDTGMFVCTHKDGDVIMTKSHLMTAYEHMSFTAVIKGEKKKVSFINTWLKHSEMRVKRCIDIIPPDLSCPDDVYNAWRDFSMSLVTDYAVKPNAVNFMLAHLMVLCNHDQYCYDYLCLWIATMIQFPSIKLPMPVFVSGEGAGKGSILRMFSALLGRSKILQTQEPSKEVWGEFNSLMLNAYLVCLDEISKKEMTGCEGKIKGLITEPTIRINDKGKSRFEVPSYHKFIAISNPDAYGNEPMNTTQDDRRRFFVQCSDELIGNTDYFDRFYAMLSCEDSMKSVYEYFNTLANARSVLKLKLPTSDYNQQLKEMATPPLKLFLADYVRANSNKTEASTADLYVALKDWTQRTGIRYECSIVAFGCRLANMRIAGLEKCDNTGGRFRLKGWRWDRPVLYKSLGLDCMITVSDDDTDVD